MFLTTFFDTHESIKILTKAGFTEEQAEGQVKVITGLIEDTLASKKDLKELEIALRTDMKKMEASLRTDMQKMEAELRMDMKTMESKLLVEILHNRNETIKWIIGAMIAQGAVIISMIKIL
jgi:Zn-dependent metalloprotease